MAAELHRRLIRNRRNISWYNQHSDFWGWYKYFTDSSNQEAVSKHYYLWIFQKLYTTFSIYFI